ncbi:cadherin-5 isoform X2 [Cebus imitator]|uniref:cadherin-5 isoform X2 n=1 Tax=Cebus imitator TaxID=2715852 RepID=UPI00189B2BD5|nr:cadherin-5 isoform X2 [Cebus imitator]
MQKLMMLVATSGACLGLLAAAAATVATGANPAQWDTPSLLPIHRRQKRDWIWNQMHIDEEKNNSLPHYVGKIKSSVNRKNAKYLLRGEFVGKVFRVDAETGDVFAIERLDRENISEYHLTAVIADKDTGENLETPSSFTIKVHDVNDNWPVFSHRLFNASVPESSAVGTSVTSVTAVDADDPTVADHASVMYQILKGKEYFAIDNTGLIVTATKNLDREKQARYEIVVEARDAQGLRGESGTATVLVTLRDINDNFPYFTQTKYTFAVPEDTRVGTSVGSLFVKDPDEPQNRMTKYSILRGDYQDAFTIETNPTHNEGIIKPMKPLDYEHIQQYSFIVEATDPTIDLRYLSVPAGNRAQVIINIIDVDEPPVFQQHSYHFQLKENQKKPLIGTVLAKDPDAARHNIGYSIRRTSDKGQFFRVTKKGDIYNEKELDREVYPWYNLTVEAKELDSTGTPTGKESIVQVHIEVLDENDNAPEFAEPYQPKVCENAAHGQLVLQISAIDKDITPQNVKFKFALKTETNFTLTDNHVITLLIFLRRRLRKQARAHGKSVAEIHEQLVAYDEEGGGEMDTTSYDVSVLNSVRHDGAKPPRTALDVRPPLYAQVQKPPRHMSGAHGGPGEMAAMIEVKKDEADHDGDGPPYDTLHIYGYEGSESIAESLSSLGTDSSDSDVDYDFLNDWGPRFKMLAELYGSDPREELLY